jgi:MarR family transcriptional regulator, organic hydroperoxide resistance regulator
LIRSVEPFTFVIVVHATIYFMNDQKYIISDSIGYLAGRVKRELTRLLARKLCDAGGQITAEQFSLLMMLWLEDGRNQQDLADLYGKDKTSIARMLQTMERHGLIIRVPDEKDKRNNLLYITQKGLEIRAKLFPTLQSSLQETEAGISAEELETCKSVLHKMVDHLSRINDEAYKGNKGDGCDEEEINCDDK